MLGLFIGGSSMLSVITMCQVVVSWLLAGCMLIADKSSYRWKFEETETLSLSWVRLNKTTGIVRVPPADPLDLPASLHSHTDSY